MQSLLKRSPNHSLSSGKIIKKANSQKKFANYFKPKPSLKLNLQPLISPKDASSLQQIVNSSNKSVRIRKNIQSKNSFNLTPYASNVLTSRKKISLLSDPHEKFYPDLNEYEKEEIVDYKEVFYAGTKCNKIQPDFQMKNAGYDCEKSNYRLVKGDHLGYRYEIISYIGRGSFGLVCECFDHKSKEHLAIKILKNKKSFHRQGAIEINILCSLRDNDPKDTENIVRLRRYFIFRRHICLVFDLLSINLYEYLKLTNFKGIKMSPLISYTSQILRGLQYLDSLSIIHCDIKPENLLLSSTTCNKLKIIDFGSSCFSHERIHSYIQSRYYRAPEVILGIPYNTSIDMWSVGCVVAELYTGCTLLQGESELDQFQLIIELLGLPPANIISQSTKRRIFFNEDGNIKAVCFKDQRPLIPASRKIEWEDPKVWDFVSRCLVWDPVKRITAKQALEHTWLKPRKHGISLSMNKSKSNKLNSKN